MYVTAANIPFICFFDECKKNVYITRKWTIFKSWEKGSRWGLAENGKWVSSGEKSISFADVFFKWYVHVPLKRKSYDRFLKYLSVVLSCLKPEEHIIT